MNKKLYTVLQWTWGLPQTLIGAAVFMMHKNNPHFDYKGAKATEWKRRDGVSLGKFIFIPEGNRRRASAQAGSGSITASSNACKKNDRGSISPESDFLLTHEYGHTIQSLILGPTYLLLVGIPSVIWNRLPLFRRLRKRTGKSYYSVIFERTATELGKNSTHKR